MSPRTLTKPQQLCAAYMLVHALLHFSARWFEVHPGGIPTSVWYAPAGLALALLVLLGPRYAPVVLLANLATAWSGMSSRELWSLFFFPTLVTANYAGAAWLVRRYLGPRMLPGDLRATLIFCATIVVAPLVTALVGTTVAMAANPRAGPIGPAFLQSILDWWIGDAMGLLTVVPFAMVFVGPWLEGRPILAGAHLGSARAIGLATLRGAVLLGTLVLVLLVPVLRERRAFYLCFLPLVWICVYDGLPGATLATLLTMMVGLVGMHLVGTTVAYSYVFLLFEVAVAGVGLGLGTVVTRRNEAEARLAASNIELARLHRLELDEKMAARLSEEKARLEVLRYQLNPHFLYNSLNSIYGLLFENPAGAGEMVLRLSEFCRATLTGATNEMPTLGAEFAALRTYLDVEKVRWGDKLQIEFRVEPATESVRLPPFLLLPLVENAIKYGSRTSPEILRLRIRAQREGNALTIEIANTGEWLLPNPHRLDSTGIGLENLRQRLQRYYPDSHEFITAASEGWVVARVCIAGVAFPAEPQPAGVGAAAGAA